MTSSSDDPDQIRRDIERTQRQISQDVDLLTEKVTPGKIVERRVSRVRGAAGRWKDAVMGSEPARHRLDDPYGDPYGSAARDPYGPYAGADPAGTGGDGVRDIGRRASDSVSGTASSAASSVSDAASSVAGAVQDAPQAARRQTQGNPLAAGLIAFGAGWLVSSLLPASRQEQELAVQAKDVAQEKGQPLAQAAQQAANEVKENLREPAQQAVESVRSTATDAGQTVAEEGKDAAQQVQGRAQDAAGTVRETR